MSICLFFGGILNQHVRRGLGRMHRMARNWKTELITCMLTVVSLLGFTAHAAERAPSTCKGTVYLTLDTGNMRDAVPIAEFLKARNIRATFFLANEKAWQGGYALDAQWADYWRDRAREGHVFGSHTLRHGRIYPDGAATPQAVSYRPQFGDGAGQRLSLSAQQFCEELKSVSGIFKGYTGQPLSGIWRAPGGKLSDAALAAARQCGFVHVGWSDSGFLGDELDSKRFPNSMLINKALKGVRSGDILLAHLGIWSRQEHFLPAFRDIIAGLQDRGLCFATLKEHPDYAGAF